MNLADALTRLTNRGRMDFPTIRGTVVSVNKDQLTCVVQPVDEDAQPILDVDLALGLEGVIPIPTIDSLVIVNMENDVTGFLASWTGLDEMRLIADKITFNPDGDYSSTFVVIEKLVTRLNNLENALNQLQTDYKTHIHTSAAPGSPTSTIVIPFLGQNVSTTTKENLENPNISQ